MNALNKVISLNDKNSFQFHSGINFLESQKLIHVVQGKISGFHEHRFNSFLRYVEGCLKSLPLSAKESVIVFEQGSALISSFWKQSSDLDIVVVLKPTVGVDKWLSDTFPLTPNQSSKTIALNTPYVRNVNRDLTRGPFVSVSVDYPKSDGSTEKWDLNIFIERPFSPYNWGFVGRRFCDSFVKLTCFDPAVSKLLPTQTVCCSTNSEMLNGIEFPTSIHSISTSLNKCGSLKQQTVRIDQIKLNQLKNRKRATNHFYVRYFFKKLQRHKEDVNLFADIVSREQVDVEKKLCANYERIFDGKIEVSKELLSFAYEYKGYIDSLCGKSLVSTFMNMNSFEMVKKSFYDDDQRLHDLNLLVLRVLDCFEYLELRYDRMISATTQKLKDKIKLFLNCSKHPLKDYHDFFIKINKELLECFFDVLKKKSLKYIHYYFPDFTMVEGDLDRFFLGLEINCSNMVQNVDLKRYEDHFNIFITSQLCQYLKTLLISKIKKDYFDPNIDKSPLKIKLDEIQDKTYLVDTHSGLPNFYTGLSDCLKSFDSEIINSKQKYLGLFKRSLFGLFFEFHHSYSIDSDVLLDLIKEINSDVVRCSYKNGQFLVEIDDLVDYQASLDTIFSGIKAIFNREHMRKLFKRKLFDLFSQYHNTHKIDSGVLIGLTKAIMGGSVCCSYKDCKFCVDKIEDALFDNQEIVDEFLSKIKASFDRENVRKKFKSKLFDLFSHYHNTHEIDSGVLMGLIKAITGGSVCCSYEDCKFCVDKIEDALFDNQEMVDEFLSKIKASFNREYMSKRLVKNPEYMSQRLVQLQTQLYLLPKELEARLAAIDTHLTISAVDLEYCEKHLSNYELYLNLLQPLYSDIQKRLPQCSIDRKFVESYMTTLFGDQNRLFRLLPTFPLMFKSVQLLWVFEQRLANRSSAEEAVFNERIQKLEKLSNPLNLSSFRQEVSQFLYLFGCYNFIFGFIVFLMNNVFCYLLPQNQEKEMFVTHPAFYFVFHVCPILCIIYLIKHLNWLINGIDDDFSKFTKMMHSDAVSQKNKAVFKQINPILFDEMNRYFELEERRLVAVSSCQLANNVEPSSSMPIKLKRPRDRKPKKDYRFRRYSLSR